VIPFVLWLVLFPLSIAGTEALYFAVVWPHYNLPPYQVGPLDLVWTLVTLATYVGVAVALWRNRDWP